MGKIVVVAKCVVCGEEKEIGAGEVKPDDTPMCPKCYMPMVADKAEVKE